MKKMRIAGAVLLAAVIPALAGCSQAQPSEDSFRAMDTFMSLSVYSDEETVARVRERIEQLDSLLSAVDSSSELARLNAQGRAKVSQTVFDAVEKSLDLCSRTDGALDITVCPVVREWGFTTGEYKIPDAQALDSLVKNVDYTRVLTDGERSEISLGGGAELDLGATAKGYAADCAKDILRESNVKSAILNLGGTVTAFGCKPSGEPWKIGVANPKNSAEYVGYISCSDKTVATSGSYERYFEGSDGKIYSHIINPKTGYPVDGSIESVSVISESGVMCDGYSTALFVLGLRGAERLWREQGGFDFVILDSGGTAYVTEGIADSFTLTDSSYTVEVVFSDGA